MWIVEPSIINSPPATAGEEKHSIRRILEAAIYIGLLLLLSAGCLWILAPFLPLLAWGIIVAVAGYPAYMRLHRLVGERRVVAAALFSLILVAVLTLPVVLLTGTLVDGVHALTGRLKSGTLTVPPPPSNIETWPVIGPPVTELWSAASANLTDVIRRAAPQVKGLVPSLLSISADVGMTILQFLLSFLVAGALLANAQKGRELAGSLFRKFFGTDGEEYRKLIVATIRSVTSGILGVALIQALFASVGFVLVGLPGSGLWAMMFLCAAVLQVGLVVLIPAMVYAFTITSGTKAIIFLVWCLIVGLIDNVLKPLFLRRGLSVPMAVIFPGAIGGFLAMGIIGFFVGAILLSVSYKLLLAWLEVPNASSQGNSGTG